MIGVESVLRRVRVALRGALNQRARHLRVQPVQLWRVVARTPLASC